MGGVVLGFIVSIACLAALYTLAYKGLHLSINDLYANVITPNFGIYIVGALAGIATILFSSLLLCSFKCSLVRGLTVLGEASLYVFALYLLVFNVWLTLFEHTTAMAIVMMAVALASCLVIRVVLRKLLPDIFN